MRPTSDLIGLTVLRLGKDRGGVPTELAEGDAVLLHAQRPCPRNVATASIMYTTAYGSSSSRRAL
jgi:hypothetical protein